MREFNALRGYKVQIDGENLFLKSNIIKEKCFLPHLEWVKLDELNFQGRGILHIIKIMILIKFIIENNMKL